MLTLSDDGVQITLMGSHSNALMVAVLMLVLAVGVALAITMLPSAYAILAVFGLACLCFWFNHHRKNNTVIATGQVWVKSGVIIYNGQKFVFDNPAVHISQDKLMIKSSKKSLILQGFENPKEISIAKAVLLGQAVMGNKVAIKMNERGLC